MMALTVRTLFEKETVLALLDEPEFDNNYTLLGARDVKPVNDHYLAIFVFLREPLDDGSSTRVSIFPNPWKAARCWKHFVPITARSRKTRWNGSCRPAANYRFAGLRTSPMGQGIWQARLRSLSPTRILRNWRSSSPPRTPGSKPMATATNSDTPARPIV